MVHANFAPVRRVSQVPRLLFPYALSPATPGADYAAKTSSLMAAMPNRIVKFLAGEIWNMTYAQGDPADFFTKREDSPASQSSAPSPSPSLPPKKRK